MDLASGLYIQCDSYLFITSIKSLCFGLCLFVCVHGNVKSNEWIFLDFYVRMAGLKEEVLKFWERSGSYSGYKNDPAFLERLHGGGVHPMSALLFLLVY